MKRLKILCPNIFQYNPCYLISKIKTYQRNAYGHSGVKGIWFNNSICLAVSVEDKRNRRILEAHL